MNRGGNSERASVLVPEWRANVLVRRFLIHAYGSPSGKRGRLPFPDRLSGWTQCVAFLTLILCVPPALGQGPYRRGSEPARAAMPAWEVDPEFAHDVFTFVRIQYDSWSQRGGWRGGGAWSTDYPDSDLNFSFRLQQLTSLTVDPHGRIIRLTDDALFDYPFIYIIEPGRLVFSPEEVEALRRYLLNGGFLMVDDFWGEQEWDNFYLEMKRVFPDREPTEVPLDHEIFHCVYDLKSKPQVPSINMAWRGRDLGITWERGPDSRTPHYKALYDDDGRMMAFICHNTDLGDGWEREGEDEWYFREFSEKLAYPLGINIVVYALTH